MEQTMSSPSSVPRWTPSPSSTRPLRSPARLADVDDAAFFPFGSSSFTPPHLRSMGEVENGRSMDQGVFLTWEDLWVSAPGRKGGRVSILCGITGFARPGEVLAMMGPSGCGKSTLLDALAGRLASNVSQKGEILINGQKQKLAFGTSAYVTQDDVLMTTLTVREAVYYSAQLQLPDSMSRAEKRARAEATIREMGLESAMDTRIGGWASKGISGGQKRRVSICVELLTRPRLLFLDEPTSGLDSAASYHVMNRIARLARREAMTVVAVIHQPSSEVFELFHGLCLLAHGRTVFFGPPLMADEFFATNGFPCPSLSNTSDHYLRTINKDFDVDSEDGLAHKSRSTCQAIELLVRSYSASDISHGVTQQIALMRNMGGSLVKKRSQASFFTQTRVLTRRSFVNMYRDLGYYWLRFAIYVALCLCVGTIYYDVGHSFGSIQACNSYCLVLWTSLLLAYVLFLGVQARGSMLMFTAAFLTFMAIGGFPSFVEDMKIFGRERLNGHYGATAFTIANTLSAAPYLALISVVPGAMAYYLVGLQQPADHFGYFALVLFTSMMVVEGLMMIVASLVPDFLMGIITGAGIQGVMMLNGGFFRLPHDLPNPVWRYPTYYIAFHRYANQGFYKNEFLGLTFPGNVAAGGPPTITGEEILRGVWQVEVGYSKWVDLAILLAMVMLYRLMFLGVVKIAEKVKAKVNARSVRAPVLSTHDNEQSSLEIVASP
ncbi:hypothetical protein OPV22_021043 [Ensete ventricosum]|uniref:ABC transporter domain-containing protein n=1 Tax=Ensete ventricosum TaxID=4639 RepID=A0AAV8PCK8_ENSVE|nr:hypothetical protein OPV22_021043 [Ensete ventricosum]